ncbi:NfeD family protein [Megamonas hypermegale]|uniref:Serine protease n=1 Tax=Megamonas hypermegale TaxID=158847 RepID=A0A921L7X5_9FIRM|nr:NfeD family protein [Megamonas hypermegale]MDM8142917.1 NfeD family protein [Megamonas hypermegale]HJF85138.1 serine protease [Megamonas hypermegale]
MDFIIDSSMVQALLLIVIFLSILVEIKTGGTGVGALLGLIAAAVFWGSSYVKGLVSLYQIALFIGGVIFIIIEILTPTIGLLAGIGVVAILYSLILAMGGDINAIYMMAISLVIAIIIFAVILKKLPSSRLWKKLILTNTSSTEQGYVSSMDYSKYLNKEGVVLSELRPSGSVEIDGVPVDVVSEGKFISKGEKVRVVKIEGVRIIVRRVE